MFFNKTEIQCWLARHLVCAGTSQQANAEGNPDMARKLSRLSTAIAVAAGAIGTQAAADDVVERTFAVQPGDQVVIDAQAASIDVTTWERSEVKIVVERADVFETLDFEQGDGTVTATARLEDRGWFRWIDWRDGSPHFQLTVPERQELNLRTSGGTIRVDGIEGTLAAHTSGGSIRAGRIDGAVDLHTSGGKVQVEHVAGAARAKTSGGSIRLGTVHGPVDAKTSGGSVEVAAAHGAIQAKTSGGSIRAAFAMQPEGPSSLRTSGGSITVRLAADLAFEINARTSGGSVSTDFPVKTTVEGKQRNNRLAGSLNGGGPELALRTSGGSIRLRRLDG